MATEAPWNVPFSAAALQNIVCAVMTGTSASGAVIKFEFPLAEAAVTVAIPMPVELPATFVSAPSVADRDSLTITPLKIPR